MVLYKALFGKVGMKSGVQMTGRHGGGDGRLLNTEHGTPQSLAPCPVLEPCPDSSRNLRKIDYLCQISMRVVMIGSTA
jgi:hypothetical protein